MSDLSSSFVASIARALNSDQVPCVLWGHYLLNVHGVPSIIGVGIPRSRKPRSWADDLPVDWLCHSGWPFEGWRKGSRSVQEPHAMSGPGSLPFKLAGAVHAATSISRPHWRLRSHRGSLSAIRDSLVPATARQLFLVTEEIQASFAIHPCVRPDCSPTLAAGSGIGCLQVGLWSSYRAQVSYLAGSISASVRARFREAHRFLCNANDWVHGAVRRWWWAFGRKPASGTPQDVLQRA